MGRTMGRSSAGARTSSTSGLFSSLPARLPKRILGPLLVLLLASCGSGGPRPGADAVAAPVATLPPISTGGASPGASAEAARLLAEARRVLEADSLGRARELARRVVEEHPGAPGASEGLWIVARAALAQGDADAAVRASDRLAEILPEEHPLTPSLRLVRGDALAETEAWEEAATAYLGISARAPDSIRQRALDGVRTVALQASFSSLERLVTRPDRVGWERLLAPVVAEYALALHVREQIEEAEVQAAWALELGAEGEAARLARSVLAGEVRVDRRRAAVLGAILPRTGSPGEQQYAELIEEGIRVRLESADRLRRLPVSLEVQDDSGAVDGLPGLVSTLGARDVVGIVGPLGEQTLAAAAGARSVPIPLISPTARVDPDGLEAVYSLGAPDPGAAEALARFATSRELGTAMVLHEASEEFTFEAEAFVRAYESRGGRVLRRIDYRPGSTFFEAALRTVREQLPDVLVLPVPAGDIELLAPQITYFGLDTLGVRILGTEGWGDPGVIQRVEPRHTDGVVLATPRLPGREAPGWERFVRDYEDALQRTLRSRIPALGYDAAGLLLEALESGARDPEEVARALERIRDFPGATGSLSIRDGRIVRSYHLARLRDREMIPIMMDEDRTR